MASVEIEPGEIAGRIAIPASKSQTLRGLLFGLMATGESRILNPLDSPDVDAMCLACEQLGGRVHRGEEIRIEGVGGHPRAALTPIDAGNSGIVLRFVGALAGLSSATLTGDASIRNSRPVAPLLEGLRQWGVAIQGERPPFHVEGPLRPGTAHIEGQDSQPVSGLLIAAAYAPRRRELIVDPVGERPWVDLTLDWLRRLGAQMDEPKLGHFRIRGGLRHPGFSYRVPGDFSTAAFPLVAGLLAGEVDVTGLDANDAQGDKELIGVLQSMGGAVSTTGARKSELCGRDIDVGPFIDALPILAVVGCFAKGETRISGGAIARRKESDRITAICSELAKMGADIEERPDGCVVRHSRLRGARVSGHRDHRIAMSLAIAALAAEGPTHIEGVDCIAKTYQTFWRDLDLLGVKYDLDRASGGGQDDAGASVGAGARPGFC